MCVSRHSLLRSSLRALTALPSSHRRGREPEHALAEGRGDPDGLCSVRPRSPLQPSRMHQLMLASARSQRVASHERRSPLQLGVDRETTVGRHNGLQSRNESADTVKLAKAGQKSPAVCRGLLSCALWRQRS